MTVERLRASLADRYTIERELGHGGMATVYLAQDLKHDRQVAIKVLRPELAAVLGAERFVQEIKTTAQLQHPHILPLFDSGEASGFLYYVMPFVQGETVRDKLNRERQLGIDEAVKITLEVADALEYAHEQGVIHRDIKPENILLHAGRPMVADFGIALAVSAAAGGRMTESGISLGTPHYMSPEQATAEKDITNRSDIYSLGSVLYEMLTGQPPHLGGTAQQIIMKIIAEDVKPVAELRRSVPPNVAAATAKALEKLPADRFATAQDFAVALTNPAFTMTGATAAAAAAPRRSRAVVYGLAAACGVLAAMAAWGWLRPAPPAPVTRFSTSLWTDPANAGELAGLAAISPDGSEIVFADSSDTVRAGLPKLLFLKRRNELTPRPLAGTEGAYGPFFSPDGAWIGFYADGHVKKIPSGGGGTVTLADSVRYWPETSGTWLDDGTIVFVDDGWRLRRVSADGGPARPLFQASGPRTYATFPQALPDARGVLFVGCDHHCINAGVYVYDMRRDTVRLLSDDAYGGWYTAAGYVLYLTREGQLLAAPWDNDQLAPTGPAVPVENGIQVPNFVLSASGAALYTLGPQWFGTNPRATTEAVWVSRSGKVEPVDPSWRFSLGSATGCLALSPGGDRLAIELNTAEGTVIWIKQLPTGRLKRLTFFHGFSGAPRWSPDGNEVTFVSTRPFSSDTLSGPERFNVWTRSATATGDPRLLWGSRGKSWVYGFWTPNGKWLILQTSFTPGKPGAQDIYTLRPGTDSAPRPLLATSRYAERMPAISPDSRWIAYQSNETGVNAVFVRPFPDIEGGIWQISTGQASPPHWAHHGLELFYFAGDTMMAVTLHPGPPFRADDPRPLFVRSPDLRTADDLTPMNWDVTPDDQRFLMVRDVPADTTRAAARLVIVANFLDELRRKVGQ